MTAAPAADNHTPAPKIACHDVWKVFGRQPERVIERPPSAELRPDQQDSDSLPPYPVLDAILDALIIDNRSVDEIAAHGFDREVTARVLEMVRRAEYKRRQAPPGVRISGRAFGRDWRYPITSGYRHKV